MASKPLVFSQYILSGLGNAAVAQLIHLLNNRYKDWTATTLFLSGILFTIVLFGALFRPVQFTIHRKNKNYHHTMSDARLPPSCMTSIEKLQRFINDMDKQCAQRHAHQSVSLSLSNNEKVPTTAAEDNNNDAISIANESDLFDSYSAGDITEIQHDTGVQIDMNTFREKISNDRTFLNERWKKITKKQRETGSNSKIFRMPNFRYLISNKAKGRSETLTVPNRQNDLLPAEKKSSSHENERTRRGSFLRGQKQNGTLSKAPLDENVDKTGATLKSGECATGAFSFPLLNVRA